MSAVERGFLLVRVGGRRVGLELCHVVAVTQLGSIYPVPTVEPAVRGVAAVQGRMVPVVHLGALLDGGACPSASPDLAVLVNVEGRWICLEIDDAEILVRDRALPVPQGSTLPWAVGVARHPEGLVPLLDLSALSSRFIEAQSR